MCVGLLVIITALNSTDCMPSGLNSLFFSFPPPTHVSYSGDSIPTLFFSFSFKGKLARKIYSWPATVVKLPL